MIRYVGFSSLPLLLISALAFANPAGAASDYPTVTVVDYVLGCMQTNGQTRQALERCSCSIDVIASMVPYEDYVRVETAMTVQNMAGERYQMLRDVGWVKDLLDRFRHAQVEADLRCFPGG